jgi:Ni,Fe-hydrogenase III large subunit/Ni,Fe-hydrogenase III component G
MKPGYVESVRDALVRQFPEDIFSHDVVRENELYLHVKKRAFAAISHMVHTGYQAPLTAMFGSDDRARGGAFRVHAVFGVFDASAWVIVRADVTEAEPVYPSLSPVIYAAHLYEREIRDMFGLAAEGNPDLRRLALHENFPDIHPLRKEFPWDAKLPRQKGSYAYMEIEGEGMFQVAVGPVHAGIIEPGHFRFSVAGEPVINLEIRLHYKHKGIEKLFETMDAAGGVMLAERVSGDSSAAHALAYAHAVEKAAGIEVPAYARSIRTVLLELERIYNHIADIGGMATDVGFSFAAAQAGILRERIMALNEKISGSRFLRGIACPGGVKKDLLPGYRDAIRDELKKTGADLSGLVEIMLGSATFMDRVEPTGVLQKDVARDLGVVGVPARASGLAHDARRDYPSELYGSIDIKVPVYTTGDVFARWRVRVDEVFESMRIIGHVLEASHQGKLSAPVGPIKPYGSAFGYVEGWRGPVFCWVEFGEGNRIERCKVRDASFCNWPGLARAVPGEIVPDFPLCNKSFNLSYSGNDL